LSKVIFVVGYYRSGTSGLSGALQKLGVAIHNEANANEHNPLGFYEIPELISLDVDLLTCLGAEWTDVRALPAGWIERADVGNFTVRLDEILRRRFPDPDKVWAVKHPHLCHLLPIYERAVKLAGHEPHVIHIFRDPAVSAASQKLKNGLSRSHALLLWLSYTTAAEHNARHLRRTWLTYEALLAQPAEQFRKIESDLGIPLSTMSPNGLQHACTYMTGELNRSAPLPEDGLYKPLRGLVSRVWSAIEGQDHRPEIWDDFRAEAADMAGFLEEISESRARSLPGFGASILLAGAPAATSTKNPLRPGERLDEAAQKRLELLAGDRARLPKVAIVIAAPAGRAANITETLETLKAQWNEVGTVKVVSMDAVTLEGIEVIQASKEAGGVTEALWPELNNLAQAYDYVAVLNAGDKLDPDACLRFAMASENSTADMIYCDEVVPRDGGAWVRYKPGWDVTRLRQSAYLGDWVWYRGKTICKLGGFDHSFAGAEEYELQLRLSEVPHHVVRLTEALFIRSVSSRRDDITPVIFGSKAVAAVKSHLERIGAPAEVEQRQFLGLFHHNRSVKDVGTSYVMLCDHAEVSILNEWLTRLLGESVLSGPIILTGTDLHPQVETYLTQIIEQADSLEGKVLAVPYVGGRSMSEALHLALDMVKTKHVAIVDIQSKPIEPNWLSQLRSRLVDPGVAMVGAKALAPLVDDIKQLVIQGPIVIGATSRLGATHAPDSPGLGGWFLVDQEASAVAPPAILARTESVKACEFSILTGDAFWIDVCAQIRSQGSRIVWTPDVSFAALPNSFIPDVSNAFRSGSEASRIHPWDDHYHHPALSLHGDLLAPETRQGLILSYPADPNSILFTGSTENAAGIMSAARAFRANAAIDATWSSEPVSAAEIRRRAPSVWVRVNPEGGACDLSPPFVALFSSSLKPDSAVAINGADNIYATSPNLLAQVQKLAAPGKKSQLWRPALTRSIWEKLQIGTGLNTRPRVIWFDEGNTPPWFMDLINETVNDLSWIVVERPGSNYSGSIARMRRHSDELGWSRDLATFAPQILVRPAGSDVSMDQYHTLLAAAVGAHPLIDKRLDTPSALKATRLPNIADSWKQALGNAARNLKQTLEAGKKAREAVLCMPSVEDQPAPWDRARLDGSSSPVLQSAAE
jgi:hypothetical protein